MRCPFVSSDNILLDIFFFLRGLLDIVSVESETVKPEKEKGIATLEDYLAKPY